jgi:transcriptional regulator with AAA-type ATPase domain
MSTVSHQQVFSDRERDAAEALSRLTSCNPFGGERIALERRALGDAFVDGGAVWHLHGRDEPGNPNEVALAHLAEELVTTFRERLAAGLATRAKGPGRGETDLYRDLVAYLLYYRFAEPLFAGLQSPGGQGSGARRPAALFRELEAELEQLCALPGRRVEPPLPAAHLFACLLQVRRAFHLVYGAFVGVSAPAARLRERVWESIFTRDMRRYRRALFQRMGDLPTLVAGPSGTGKELVARAIGQARYIPWDPVRGAFEERPEAAFFPLNLAALSPTLIESELFGHRRGAFTGAVEERPGWLEVCPPLGAVFLDEIAEVEPAIQVKLLRVLETRAFQRLGETRPRSFRGKLIAATNRDLAAEMRHGRFREDLYYRLCADTLATPTLQERLRDTPAELALLVDFLSRRLVGEEEGPALAREVVAWVETHLGAGYAWPGNVRELAQCVSNVLIRGAYEPAGRAAAGEPADARQRLVAELGAGTLGAEEALSRYCTLVYADAGSYLEAAGRLGLDRRTVASRVDRRLAAALARSR